LAVDGTPDINTAAHDELLHLQTAPGIDAAIKGWASQVVQSLPTRRRMRSTRGGGAPRCQLCSTKKPISSKKKSIKKKKSKKKTKKKYIKKSPKYSTKKSLKKKSFKKGSRKKTLRKKSKRKSKK
jgi:hypothetical protein